MPVQYEEDCQKVSYQESQTIGCKRVAGTCKYADLHWGGRVQGEFLTMATKMERGAFQTQHIVKDREDPIYAQEAANSNEQPQFFPSVSFYISARWLRRNAKHQQLDRRRILRLEEEPKLSLRHE